MNVSVRLFARLRERLGCSATELEVESPQISIEALVENLIQVHGELWRQELTAPNVLCAVNREVVDPGTLVTAGDEVAFYPPVTGG